MIPGSPQPTGPPCPALGGLFCGFNRLILGPGRRSITGQNVSRTANRDRIAANLAQLSALWPVDRCSARSETAFFRSPQHKTGPQPDDIAPQLNQFMRRFRSFMRAARPSIPGPRPSIPCSSIGSAWANRNRPGQNQIDPAPLNDRGAARPGAARPGPGGCRRSITPARDRIRRAKRGHGQR